MADYEGLKGRNPELEEVDVDFNEASNIAQNYKPENDDVPPGGNAALLEQWKKEKEILAESDITRSEYLALREMPKLMDSEIKQMVKYSINRKYRHLSLPNLKEITDKQVEYLSNGNVLILSLDGLTSITDKQAEYLSNCGYFDTLCLKGLTSITDKQAEYLGNGNIDLLNLDGLTSITDKQAEYLSNGNFHMLSLDGLTSITDKQAEYLSNGNFHTLSLDGLTSITDKQAEEFAKLEKLYIESSILTPKQKDILKRYD